jgi:acyl-CoA reductase-like NAD-dependent aldehyde dehydrogenase
MASLPLPKTRALALANDNVYGLSGAVFTRDLSSGFRISKGYKIGSVHINGMTIHDETAIPHRGVKNTRFGRFNGMAGLDEYLTYKAVSYLV